MRLVCPCFFISIPAAGCLLQRARRNYKLPLQWYALAASQPPCLGPQVVPSENYSLYTFPPLLCSRKGDQLLLLLSSSSSVLAGACSLQFYYVSGNYLTRIRSTLRSRLTFSLWTITVHAAKHRRQHQKTAQKQLEKLRVLGGWKLQIPCKIIRFVELCTENVASCNSWSK